MKLKTKMSNATGKWIPCVTWGDPLGAAMNHDAAAANALMLAMESVWDGEPDIFRPAIEMVEKRANAFMAEWGFDTVENA